jgi:hypothetical protein
MAQYNKAGFLGYCQFCGQRMKIAESINNRVDISRLFVCKTPSCGKETYWTKEVHLARFAHFEEFERQQLEARVAAHPNTVKPDIIPRDPFIVSPVVEHSYERALTPVEPQLDIKAIAREQDRVRDIELAALAKALAVEAEPDVEAVNPLAREIEQNKEHYALEKKLKKQFKNGEITIEEHDRQLRELHDGWIHS